MWSSHRGGVLVCETDTACTFAKRGVDVGLGLSERSDLNIGIAFISGPMTGLRFTKF